MKDINRINRNTKAAAVLIFVTILLLISNYFMGLNSKKTNETIKAIYNDRLMVSHYVFQYTHAVYQIKETANTLKITDFEKQQFILSRLKTIHQIDKKYLKTILTPDEKKQFRIFQNQCIAIETQNKDTNWQKMSLLSEQSLGSLAILARIQVDEGKTAMIIANALHDGNQFFSQFEIALYVILACLSAYLLLLKKMKVKIKIPENPSMN